MWERVRNKQFISWSEAKPTLSQNTNINKQANSRDPTDSKRGLDTCFLIPAALGLPIPIPSLMKSKCSYIRVGITVLDLGGSEDVMTVLDVPL